MITLIVCPPRSGSVAFMRACEAGGLPVRVNPERVAPPPEPDGFQLHPGSLYELWREDLQRPDFETWAEGYVLKVLFPMLPFLPALTQMTYRVALLVRDHEELRQAHEAARIQSRPVEWFAERYVLAMEQLQRPDVATIQPIRYADLVFHPRETLASLGWELDVEKAATVVDPDQYVMRNPMIGAPKHPDHPYLTVGL